MTDRLQYTHHPELKSLPHQVQIRAVRYNTELCEGMTAWCREQYGPPGPVVIDGEAISGWGAVGSAFFFAKHQDAMALILRWG